MWWAWCFTQLSTSRITDGWNFIGMERGTKLRGGWYPYRLRLPSQGCLMSGEPSWVPAW